MRHAMPSHEELQAVVGRALTDPAFCKDLLNGHRRERLSEYELTAEEREAAIAVDASDLATFAREIDQWISSRPVAKQSLPARDLPRMWTLFPAA